MREQEAEVPDTSLTLPIGLPPPPIGRNGREARVRTRETRVALSWSQRGMERLEISLEMKKHHLPQESDMDTGSVPAAGFLGAVQMLYPHNLVRF